ncbi:hypothetical protein A9R05_42010 (plasmid) [Burkholderia sp. KK1]|nr:hypothetical protein A9R05_42010 [Burkholderia sp. KK1]
MLAGQDAIRCWKMQSATAHWVYDFAHCLQQQAARIVVAFGEHSARHLAIADLAAVLRPADFTTQHLFDSHRYGINKSNALVDVLWIKPIGPPFPNHFCGDGYVTVQGTIFRRRHAEATRVPEIGHQLTEAIHRRSPLWVPAAH